MQYFDVCNGDADGLIARHQFRLSFPVPTAALSLITGPKRDISLLARVDLAGVVANQVEINVFDISYDQNAESVRRLLQGGVSVRYFDHHRADQLQPHPRLTAHIDTSADVCTSLMVDRFLGGAHRTWAIAAAFGDNLTGIAERLATEAMLSPAQTSLLRQLGECINYNAYGETMDDLHFAPAEIARRMMPYRDPFEFAEREDVFRHLQTGFSGDLQRAQSILPVHASKSVAVFVLPGEPWARRVSGTLANALVRSDSCRAYAVITTSANGTYTVSIRAPQANPEHADAVASAFGGSGRTAAAGINNLPTHDIDRLISMLEQTYGMSVA